MPATLLHPLIDAPNKCFCFSAGAEMPPNGIDFLFKEGSVVRDAEEEHLCTFEAVLHDSRDMTEGGRNIVLTHLSALRKRLKEWCKSYANRVDTACLVPYMSPYEFCFVVMVRDNHYDVDFADTLSKLEMDVADDECFGAVTMKAVDVPKNSERRFVQRVMSLQRFI